MDPDDRPGLPPNIEILRSRLFTMHEPLTLPVAEFDAAWKYLDNMYIPNTCRRAKSAPTVTTYYSCRLWRKETHATVTPEKRKRNKPSRVAIGCPCRLKTITDERAMTITFTRKTPPHNHEYPELDGKLSTGAKELLRREVVKGYSTPYLARAMKEEKYGTWQYMKAAGGGGLTQKDVMNAVQTYRREHPDAKGDIDIQVKDLVTLLLLKYWFVSEIKTENAHGVVFSHMDGLSGLRRRGCLVLTETADQMSRLQWRLTSFTIRDEYGSWVPAAFFLRDSLDTELMKMAFSQLRTWCADQWPLRYIISDGSMGGQDVANSIFEGQDRKVTHYFSTIHSERLLRQYFGKNDPPAAQLLRAALYKCQTEAGCHNTIDAAIQSCATRPHKEYIAREWKASADQWAMYARQHSVLLQTKSTLRVQNWHTRLTQAGALDVIRWSLSSVGNRIVESTQQCMGEAKQAYKTFRTKDVDEFILMPMLLRFPFPAQELILAEFRELEDRTPIVERDDSEEPCSCLFSRKWKLPCVHVLSRERVVGNVFSDAYWKKWYSHWDRCGFEIYEHIAPDPILGAAEKDRLLGSKTQREIHVRKILKGLMSEYDEVESKLVDQDPRVQAEAHQAWINGLLEATRPLMQRPLLSAPRPVDGPQQAEGSQSSAAQAGLSLMGEPGCDGAE